MKNLKKRIRLIEDEWNKRDTLNQLIDLGCILVERAGYSEDEAFYEVETIYRCIASEFGV